MSEEMEKIIARLLDDLFLARADGSVTFNVGKGLVESYEVVQRGSIEKLIVQVPRPEIDDE